MVIRLDNGRSRQQFPLWPSLPSSCAQDILPSKDRGGYTIEWLLSLSLGMGGPFSSKAVPIPSRWHFWAVLWPSLGCGCNVPQEELFSRQSGQKKSPPHGNWPQKCGEAGAASLFLLWIVGHTARAEMLWVKFRFLENGSYCNNAEQVWTASILVFLIHSTRSTTPEEKTLCISYPDVVSCPFFPFRLCRKPSSYYCLVLISKCLENGSLNVPIRLLFLGMASKLLFLSLRQMQEAKMIFRVYTLTLRIQKTMWTLKMFPIIESARGGLQAHTFVSRSSFQTVWSQELSLWCWPKNWKRKTIEINCCMSCSQYRDRISYEYACLVPCESFVLCPLHGPTLLFQCNTCTHAYINAHVQNTHVHVCFVHIHIHFLLDTYACVYIIQVWHRFWG